MTFLIILRRSMLKCPEISKRHRFKSVLIPANIYKIPYKVLGYVELGDSQISKDSYSNCAPLFCSSLERLPHLTLPTVPEGRKNCHPDLTEATTEAYGAGEKRSLASSSPERCQGYIFKFG